MKRCKPQCDLIVSYNRALIALAIMLASWTFGEPAARAQTAFPDNKSLPPLTTGLLTRIGFGSCSDQKLPQPIWASIQKANPNLFLMLGDNIYGDTEDMAVMRAKYEQFAAIPEFKAFRATCPFMAIWDDHDYGVNDGGLEYPKRRESQQLFLDFWGEPVDSPRRRQLGVYDARIFGPEGKRVQIIMLDTRHNRSPLKLKDPARPGRYVGDDSAQVTFLGEAQWQWLAEQLKQPAEIRLIASGIQVVHEDHESEKWMNFPHERARLFQTIRDAKAAGVIFLSGDRHIAEFSLMDGGIGYPIYDLTASGLNRAAKNWRAQEVNRHRVATMNFGDNFGLIEVDWNRPDPLLRLQIRDVNGEVTLQQKIPLSLLRPKG